MPALRRDEIRLPELHLPEMSRDEIVRAFSEAKPTIDLSRLDPRRNDVPEPPRIDAPRLDLSRIDLPKVDIAKLDLPQIDLAKIDLPKAVAAAAQTAGLMRKPRSRLLVVIGGLVVVALVGAAVLTSPAVKPRLTEAARRWRERLEARRAARGGAIEPVAFDAAVAVPVQPSAYSDVPTEGSPFDGPSSLPEGLGAAASDAPSVADEPARA